MRVRYEHRHSRNCSGLRHCRDGTWDSPWALPPWDSPKLELEDASATAWQRSGPGAGLWLRVMCLDTLCPGMAQVNMRDLAVYIAKRLR